MKKLLLSTFVLAAVFAGQVGTASFAHAETSTTTNLSSLQEMIKNLQAQIAELRAQIGKTRGTIKETKKEVRKEVRDHNSSDDGFDVEIEIERGIVDVSFVFGSTTHDVTVGTSTSSSTLQTRVLAAVADELDVTVANLDADLVAAIKKELARKGIKIDRKLNKKEQKEQKRDMGKSREASKHIAQAEREIAEAKADGATDADLADATDLLADAKAALVAKNYKEAKELAKDAKDAAKDWESDDEDEDDEDDEDEDDN